jgi:hypothetical protein
VSGVEEVALVAAIAGAGVSAYSAVQSGQQQKSAADFNAATAARNAQIAQDQGAQQAAMQQRNAAKQLDAARAATGASGVTMEGSPLDALQNSAMNASLDNQTIKYNAKIKAYGNTNEAGMYTAEGNAMQTKGYMTAGSDILTGAAGAYSIYNRGGAGGSLAPARYGYGAGSGLSTQY